MVRECLCAVLFVGMVALSGFAVAAEPVDYVRVCDRFGTGFIYVPGTERCLNPETGQTKREVDVDVIEEGLSPLAQKVEDLQARFDQAFEGVAVGLAIPTAMIEPNHHFAVAGAVGAFEGAFAVGFSAALRASENLTLNGGVGVGTDQGVVGGRAGFNLSW